MEYILWGMIRREPAPVTFWVGAKYSGDKFVNVDVDMTPLDPWVSNNEPWSEDSEGKYDAFSNPPLSVETFMSFPGGDCLALIADPKTKTYKFLVQDCSAQHITLCRSPRMIRGSYGSMQCTHWNREPGLAVRVLQAGRLKRRT